VSEIDYIYFDVDNGRLLKSLDELKDVYFKGIEDAYEHVYMETTQILYAMSSYPCCKAHLKAALMRLWRKQKGVRFPNG